MPLPEGKISYNKDTISKLAKKQRAAEGYFGLKIVNAEPSAPKDPDNYDVQSKLTLRPLKNPNDIDSVTGKSITIWITWPFKHPDNPDHEPPQWAADQTCGLLHALDPDKRLDVPRWDRRTRKLYFKGQEISSEEESACREEALEDCFKSAVALYNDHASLVGHRIFGRVYYPKDKPNFPKVAAMSAEPQDGLSETFIELVGGDENIGHKKSNGARERARPARGRKGSRSARRKRVS